jgi:hypothetical protein
MSKSSVDWVWKLNLPTYKIPHDETVEVQIKPQTGYTIRVYLYVAKKKLMHCSCQMVWTFSICILDNYSRRINAKMNAVQWYHLQLEAISLHAPYTLMVHSPLNLIPVPSGHILSHEIISDSVDVPGEDHLQFHLISRMRHVILRFIIYRPISQQHIDRQYYRWGDGVNAKIIGHQRSLNRSGRSAMPRSNTHTQSSAVRTMLITLSRWNKILPMYQITDKDREVVSSSSSGNK